MFKIKLLSILIFSIFASATALSQNYKAKLISGGFRFTEGPAADHKGNVYFSDIPENKIFKWNGKDIELFTDKVDGCNGLMFINNEHIVICESRSGRKVSKINTRTKEISLLAADYNGKLFNSPNDLWINSAGGIYFTDPRYGNRDNMEMDTEQVYYIHPETRNVSRITDDLVKPNGIIGSLDGKKIYIADPGDEVVYSYIVGQRGNLKNKTLFVEGIKVDGMTIDHKGNLYLSSNNIEVYNPEGKLLIIIEVPEQPTNVCFIDNNKQKLFITARTGVYYFDFYSTI